MKVNRMGKQSVIDRECKKPRSEVGITPVDQGVGSIYPWSELLAD
jgi:hypothetical protein